MTAGEEGYMSNVQELFNLEIVYISRFMIAFILYSKRRNCF
jgi:hypothetical protein